MSDAGGALMVGMTAELEVMENSARRLQTAGVTRPVILLGQARPKSMNLPSFKIRRSEAKKSGTRACPLESAGILSVHPALSYIDCMASF